MFAVVYSLVVIALAALPALLTVRNLKLFLPAPQPSRDPHAPVSVLIPARNEESGIGAAVHAVLANRSSEIEVLVLDDDSDDATPTIVQEISVVDPRVRLLQSDKLPEGWNGKQYACWQLANAARHGWLLFLDADVRLSADSIARLMAKSQSQQLPLLSGFPNEETGTLAEKLLIPMMHFVLLGFLPLDQMRKSTQPEFGAGCGQLFLARRDEYFAAGGHQAIQGSRHDGLKLPRAFRAAGFATDLLDASDIATVRMYTSLAEVTNGLLKNATEGIANSRLIFIFSLLLLGGSVVPLLSLAHALFWNWNYAAVALLVVATLVSFLPRLLIARRLRQSWWGVALHPLAVTWFVLLQWMAFLRQLTGQQAIAWRGRN